MLAAKDTVMNETQAALTVLPVWWGGRQAKGQWAEHWRGRNSGRLATRPWGCGREGFRGGPPLNFLGIKVAPIFIDFFRDTKTQRIFFPTVLIS